MDSKVSIDMVLTIIKGRGFVTSEEQNIEEMPLGTIATDLFSHQLRMLSLRLRTFM